MKKEVVKIAVYVAIEYDIDIDRRACRQQAINESLAELSNMDFSVLSLNGASFGKTKTVELEGK